MEAQPAAQSRPLVDLLSQLEEELDSSPNDLLLEFCPYIYHLLTEKGLLDNASAQLIGQLRAQAMHAASIAVGRHHILGSLGNYLEKSGIQCILLKGAALDGMAYPDQAFRLGCDIDLLVKEEDYYRIEKALKGFAAPYDLYPERPQFTDFVTERSFIVKKPTPTSFDVHRELTIPYLYKYSLDSFFFHAITHPRHRKLFTLNPEDNLLQFAMHGFYNLQNFNKHTLDAYQLIMKADINWEELFSRATKIKLIKPLLYLLDGMEQTFSYTPPSKHFADYKNMTIQRALAKYLMSPKYANSEKAGWYYRLRQLASQVLISGNLQGHLRFNYYHLKAKLLDLTHR